jgi:repressor of nif and glnA expression
MSFQTQDAERRASAILQVLSDSREPLGARNISRRLQECGIELTERAVRFHLKHFDDTGLTKLVPKRAGRILTPTGHDEVRNALVRDKIGFALTKIDSLAFRTDFDLGRRSGLVPASVSFFPKEEFSRALHAMKPVFDSGLSTSELVAVAQERRFLGGLTVPDGKIGFATVCSIVINAVLLKAGIPVDARFGGILEVRNREPLRFVEVIHYGGTSIDPCEVFISARMTDVQGVAASGNGRLLGSLHEIAAVCRREAKEVMVRLEEADLNGLLVMGITSHPVCEAPVGLDRIGVILLDGLNPVAAVEEAGIRTENRSMGTMLDYQELIPFRQLPC